MLQLIVFHYITLLKRFFKTYLCVCQMDNVDVLAYTSWNESSEISHNVLGLLLRPLKNIQSIIYLLICLLIIWETLGQKLSFILLSLLIFFELLFYDLFILAFVVLKHYKACICTFKSLGILSEQMFSSHWYSSFSHQRVSREELFYRILGTRRFSWIFILEWFRIWESYKKKKEEKERDLTIV